MVTILFPGFSLTPIPGADIFLPALSPVFIAAYLLVNGISFCLFAFDKYAACNGCWRVSERSLLIAALFGPFGGLAAMILFRHKIRNAKFLLVPFFAVIHIVALLIVTGFISPSGFL